MIKLLPRNRRAQIRSLLRNRRIRRLYLRNIHPNRILAKQQTPSKLSLQAKCLSRKHDLIPRPQRTKRLPRPRQCTYKWICIVTHEFPQRLHPSIRKNSASLADRGASRSTAPDSTIRRFTVPDHTPSLLTPQSPPSTFPRHYPSFHCRGVWSLHILVYLFRSAPAISHLYIRSRPCAN